MRQYFFSCVKTMANTSSSAGPWHSFLSLTTLRNLTKIFPNLLYTFFSILNIHNLKGKSKPKNIPFNPKRPLECIEVAIVAPGIMRGGQSSLLPATHSIQLPWPVYYTLSNPVHVPEIL